jgi:hypothetical protein
MTKHRDRALREAECGFTAELVNGPCGDCGKKMKDGSSVYWFPYGGKDDGDLYVGECCIKGWPK